MAKAEDYGTDKSEVTLVPQALRAYRHFLLYQGELWPMSADTQGGFNPYAVRSYVPRSYVPPALEPYYRYDDYGYKHRDYEYEYHYSPPTNARVWEAQCKIWRDSMAVPGPHPAPRADCRCGFYAHYEPNGDFYPSQTWDDFREDDRRRVNPFDVTSNNPPPYAMVRAVVELSGTVVLGTRGVRAEKMRIVAAALDWSKWSNTSIEHSNYVVRADEMDMFGTFYGDMVSLYYLDRRPGADTLRRGQDELNRIAHMYGFTPYYNIQTMHSAHPQPDLGDLRPKEGDTV